MAVATPSRPKAGGGRLYVMVGTLLALLSVVIFVALGGVLIAGHGGSSKVVVAAKAISLRSTISPDELTYQDMSPAPAGTFNNISLVKGQAAELNIAPGEPILSSMISKSPDSIQGPAPAFLKIPKGFVAITIPTSEQQGVAGYPQPGDYLNVVFTTKWPPIGGTSLSISKTVFNNLEIIRVGPATVTTGGANGTSQGTQTQGVASSLTVLMTQCDAEFMNWFMANGTLQYQLESYKDYVPAPTKPDPSCPSITGTKGVSAGDVDGRYHLTTGIKASLAGIGH